MTFYDSHGKAIAYLHDDGIHIYLFNGRPVAYLYGDAVYGFNGHQFGWFEDGWIRDLNLLRKVNNYFYLFYFLSQNIFACHK